MHVRMCMCDASATHALCSVRPCASRDADKSLRTVTPIKECVVSVTRIELIICGTIQCKCVFYSGRCLVGLHACWCHNYADIFRFIMHCAWFFFYKWSGIAGVVVIMRMMLSACRMPFNCWCCGRRPHFAFRWICLGREASVCRTPSAHFDRFTCTFSLSSQFVVCLLNMRCGHARAMRYI